MAVVSTIRAIGHRIVNMVWRIGVAARFFFLTLRYSGTSFSRFHLIIKELFSTGVMSLIIIVVAGLFVGMVLGLQGSASDPGLHEEIVRRFTGPDYGWMWPFEGWVRMRIAETLTAISRRPPMP